MITNIQKLALLASLPLLIAAWVQMKNGHPSNAPRISVEVMTGRMPPGCSGRGICSINQAVQGQSGYAGEGFIAEIYKNETGHIALEIPRSNISAQAAAEQFVNAEFLLPGDFNLPANIVTALEMSTDRVILKAGTYPVQSTPTYFTIIFKR